MHASNQITTLLAVLMALFAAPDIRADFHTWTAPPAAIGATPIIGLGATRLTFSSPRPSRLIFLQARRGPR